MSEFDSSLRYLVDSNIFLRIFVRDNEKHWQECMELLDAITQNKINAYIPTFVAAEVNFVLTSFYQFDKVRVIQAMKSLVGIANLKVTDDLSIIRATELYEQHRVKFTDCLLASSKLISEGKAAIVSYDRDFDNLGITRIEPGNLLPS